MQRQLKYNGAIFSYSFSNIGPCAFKSITTNLLSPGDLKALTPILSGEMAPKRTCCCCCSLYSRAIILLKQCFISSFFQCRQACLRRAAIIRIHAWRNTVLKATYLAWRHRQVRPIRADKNNSQWRYRSVHRFCINRPKYNLARNNLGDNLEAATLNESISYRTMNLTRWMKVYMSDWNQIQHIKYLTAGTLVDMWV